MTVGRTYWASDSTASSPKENPVHPNDLLATVYWSLGIDPDMTVLNHLNQPRELVKGKPVLAHGDLIGSAGAHVVICHLREALPR